MLVRELGPRSMWLRVSFLSPHILALPEEAREDMLEMKSDQVFGEKAAQEPHSAFPILEPLPPWPYHILIDELPQVPKTMFLSDGVGVVAMLVGHTVCL